MGVKIKNNQGQITIFVILAILIVTAVITLFFVFRSTSVEEPFVETPRGFIDKCIKDAVKDSVRDVLYGGGRVKPSFYMMYNDTRYNYLCYQDKYYITCVNHYPLLKRIIEKEIYTDTVDDVDSCFNDLVTDYRAKGYDVSEEDLEYSIELVSERVRINVQKRVSLVLGDNAQSFEDFDTSVISAIYELQHIAHEIVNQETQFCNFEYNGFMALYPEYDIKRVDYSDSKIYRIIDRHSGDEFKMAVRSCAFPPGI